MHRAWLGLVALAYVKLRADTTAAVAATTVTLLTLLAEEGRMGGAHHSHHQWAQRGRGILPAIANMCILPRPSSFRSGEDDADVGGMGDTDEAEGEAVP